MDFVDVLRERRERVRERLERDPLFRELELIERLILTHESGQDQPNKKEAVTRGGLAKLASAVAKVPSQPGKPPVVGRSVVLTKAPAVERSAVAVKRVVPFTTTATGMRAVLTASEEYLRRKDARAESNEIHRELIRLGILKEGDADRSKVTSYLGRDKRTFDNVRGEGYGLREWSTEKA